MRNAWLAGVLVLLVGCKEDKQCSVSVGSCTSQHAQSCGVSITCKDSRLQIKCTPPADMNAKQMDCQCIENGVIGKSVQVVHPLSAPSAESLARTACDWKK